MDGITLGQIMQFLAWMAAVIGTTGVVYKFFQSATKKFFGRLLSGQLLPLRVKLDAISDSIVDVDMTTCKNFLVRFLADIEQGNPIDEVEKERFHEVYARYQRLGGNSYIHNKVEKLKAERKI